MKQLMKKMFLLAIPVIVLSSCASTKADPPPPLSEGEKRILKKLGGVLLPDGNIRLGKITIHRLEQELSFPAYINMTSGALEVLISTETGRTHESLLVSKIDPFNLQIALLLLGFKNGRRLKDGSIEQGTLINIEAVILDDSDSKRHPIENWLYNKTTEKEMGPQGWVFVGSNFTHNKVCLATKEGNIVNVWSFGNTILDNPGETGNYDDTFDVHTENIPAFKTKLRVYMTAAGEN